MGQRSAKRSPRLRLAVAAEKSQNFFPLLPTSSSLLPLLLPLLPAVAAAARLRFWGLGRLLACSFAGSGGGGFADGSEPGVPRRGVPPALAGGLAVWRIRGGRRRGTAWGTKGGGGGDRLGRRGVLKPPRPHPGSARGAGAAPGGEHGGATVFI